MHVSFQLPPSSEATAKLSPSARGPEDRMAAPERRDVRGSRHTEEETMAETVQFNLKSDEIPTAWYNILPDMAAAGIPPLPPLHPGTHEPVTPDLLLPLFPESLVKQEVSSEPWIDIPGAVLDVYRLWRPTPLYRARRLEQALKTPAHIYFKYEGTSPVGSHKPNTAVAQGYYNKEAGPKRPSTATGAGRWAAGVSSACGVFGLDCV